MYNQRKFRNLISEHFPWQLQVFVCLGSTFFVARAVLLKHPLKNWKIAKTYCNSDVKCLVDMSFLKEVSQKRFVFEFQSFIFGGSLGLRFWASKLDFWRKSRRKASFWASRLQNFWISNALNLTSIESHINWISNWMTCPWIESQTKWLSNQLNPEAMESEIIWTWNISISHHLNLKSLTWISNHGNTQSMIDNQITWISNQLTTKPLENQMNWQQKHLNLKAIESRITWISNPLNLNPNEMQNNWIWHQLIFEPIELHTPSSYRFLKFGNFRHRLVR